VSGEVVLTGELPFIGRSAELDGVVSLLLAGEVRAVVIAGPAGAGKSRLAAEVRHTVTLKGWRVEHLLGSRALSSIPFGAFAPLLSEAESGASALLHLLKRGAAAIAARNRPDAPLLLVVDDAHQLDDGSAALLLELARSRACRIVATLRVPGPAPDAVTGLWKDGLAVRLELPALSAGEVELLAAAALGGAMTGASVRALYDASGGNAMFVRELLIGALQAGTLRNVDGVWVLRGPLPVRGRLAELVAARLAELTPPTAEVVDLLALGEPLGLPLLEALASADAVEDAERRGLVSWLEDGRRHEARLGHPLYGEARRQHMPRARRRRLSAALASAVLANGARRRDDVLRVARWQLDAGAVRDAQLFSRAAAAARAKFDLGLAARLARAALEAGGGVAAALALGEAEFFAGRHGEAERVLASAAAVCTTEDEATMIANARAYNTGFLIGDIAAAERILAEALAQVQGPRDRLSLIGRRATLRTWSGELRIGLEDALEVASSPDPVVARRGTMIGSIALALQGRGVEAIELAQRGLALQRAAGRTHVPETQLMGSILAGICLGRLELAEAECERGYASAITSGDDDAVATFALLRGLVAVESGDLSGAARDFREGMAINQAINDPGPLRWCAGGVALAEGMAGRAPAAAAAVEQVDALPAHWMAALELDLVERGRAWALVAGGELPAARARLRGAAAAAAAADHLAVEARLWHDVVRLGEPAAAVTRLGELASLIGGELVPVLAAHARATLSGSYAELEPVARSFEEIGADLLAAEAACQVAAACRRERLLRLGAAWDHRTWDLRRRVGEVRTPLLSGVDSPEPLTARERDIAELAAAGTSTKEIAERLFLSRRTVENHLQHAYTKLGVRGRDELAVVLGRR
jgi:DNA-binding CsgD family transcriptional regulator